MKKIGACLSFIDSDLKRTAQEAISIGANTFMMYIGSPTQYKKPVLNIIKIVDGLDFMKSKGMTAEDIILHTSYLANFASPEESKRITAMNALAQEIELAKQVGIKYLVCHPGSYTTGNPKSGIENIANCINSVLEEHDDVIICLETMAGKGKELGRDFEELQCIIEQVELDHKVGICLDTAHVWDAGYDLRNPDDVLNEFDGIIGLDKLKVIHLNGSLNNLGAKKDRHANIFTTSFGENKIGSDALWNFYHHPLLKNVSFILETPDQGDGTFMFADEIKFLSEPLK